MGDHLNQDYCRKGLDLMSAIDQAYRARTKSDDIPSWLIEAKAAVRDLAEPNPVVYWADLLLTIAVGYTCALGFLKLPGVTWTRGVCYVIAVFAIFRASSFVHEIIHLRGRHLRSFQIGWDLLCGIPLLFPSFAYTHHLDHHRCDSYGTDHDGEYLPFGLDPPRLIGYYVLLTMAWPVLVVFRFLLLTPLSFLYPPFRRWLLERFSSFGIINFQHRLAITPNRPLRYWAFLDIACCLRVWTPFALVALGIYQWWDVGLLFFFAASVLSLNFVRTLCLHHYLSDDGPVSYLEQLQDSITLPDNVIVTEMFVPLGLRFHALHHLFPHLPYHVLGRAHRRLMKELPADSDYHRTVRSGISAIFVQFWKNTWHKPASQPAENGQLRSEPPHAKSLSRRVHSASETPAGIDWPAR